MSKPKHSSLLDTFTAAPAPLSTDAPAVKPLPSRRKQLAFLVTADQETRLNHFRADMGNMKIQEMIMNAINMLLASKGQPPL